MPRQKYLACVCEYFHLCSSPRKGWMVGWMNGSCIVTEGVSDGVTVEEREGGYGKIGVDPCCIPRQV